MSDQKDLVPLRFGMREQIAEGFVGEKRCSRKLF